jgi:hypothetical protein
MGEIAVVKVQSARRVVKRFVSSRVRGRTTVNQKADFKTSNWYHKAALSISAAPSAARRIDKTHEQVYRMILGSQINFLRALAQSPWLPSQRGRQTLDAAKVTQPWLKDTSFEQWLGFLGTMGMIFYNSSSDQIVITDAGRRFLVYMTANGLPDKI